MLVLHLVARRILHERLHLLAVAKLSELQGARFRVTSPRQIAPNATGHIRPRTRFPALVQAIVPAHCPLRRMPVAYYRTHHHQHQPIAKRQRQARRTCARSRRHCHRLLPARNPDHWPSSLRTMEQMNLLEECVLCNNDARSATLPLSCPPRR